MSKISLVFLSITILLCFFLPGNSQENYYKRLADSAYNLTLYPVTYDPGYYVLSYPLGDIPPNKGVCTDVIIRAYRMMGIDLQVKVHEDMMSFFSEYPNNWGLNHPDKNIDHRRVPNLMVFFERHGDILSLSQDPGDYHPGDIVCWNLGGGITHIGLVASFRTIDLKRPLILHNIGAGQVLQDCLFNYKIIGHYRYFEEINNNNILE